MLHAVSGRFRALPTLKPTLPQEVKFCAPQAQKQQATALCESRPATLSKLPSLQGCVFSPVFWAAASVMGWRLQRDGFIVRNIAVGSDNIRIWDAPGQGTGPCAVVLHGLGGSSCEYRDPLVWLQRRCRRVIAIDLPGHGGSTPVGKKKSGPYTRRAGVIDAIQKRINQALDTVLDEPANLIGHSLGGYVAMRYALEGTRRHHVKGLVLVSPDGAPWTEQELHDDAAMFDVRHRSDAADIAARTYPQNPMRAALIAPFIGARFDTPEMRFLNHSDAKQPALSPTQLAHLPPRVLLIVGQQERFDPEHNLAYFKAHLPATTTVRRPNTGHGDIVDAHPEVMATMQDFLKV